MIIRRTSQRTSQLPEIQGTTGNDRITDTADSRRILALGGDDFVNGFGGNDEIYGNLGADTLNGGLGSDLLFGGRDNDALDGQEENDQIFGNLGADILVGNSGDDSLFGGRDNDVLNGSAGNDLLSGDLGFDVLIGSFGNDTLVVRVDPEANSFDYLRDFIPGEDKIALGGGLIFNDLEITTARSAGLTGSVQQTQALRSQFAPWGSNLSNVVDESLVLRVRSTGQTLAILNHQPTNTISPAATLTTASLTPADFVAI
ncbi:MAG: calcium-binding protein [Oscillatoriales cyanobacterium]|nr:MAG: calcium-binding protein [Oscillatoriales cyanobacterium]